LKQYIVLAVTANMPTVLPVDVERYSYRWTDGCTTAEGGRNDREYSLKDGEGSKKSIGNCWSICRLSDYIQEHNKLIIMVGPNVM